MAECLAHLAPLAVDDQDAEGGGGEVDDRGGDDRRQRIEQQAPSRKGEPGACKGERCDDQPPGEADGGADEGGDDDEAGAQHRDQQDLHAIGPIRPREEVTGEDLLDGLRVNGDAGHVFAERCGADILQAGRRGADEDDAALHGCGDFGRGPIGRQHLAGGDVAIGDIGAGVEPELAG